ncbi:hypothetical protein B0T21DRAFT_295720, partial [Apiosordaria backusii]
ASNCELAAATYNVDLEEFGLWNPGLGNVSDPAYAFEKGVRYCGSWYLEAGSPADCNKWSLVTDGLTCTALASQAGITLKQFLAWNPAVSSDCVTNYWLGEAYCVGVSA